MHTTLLRESSDKPRMMLLSKFAACSMVRAAGAASLVRGLGLFILLCGSVVSTQAAQWIISANESKVDLVSGAPRVVLNPAPDTLTLMDFSMNPPRVLHITNVSNSVLGPPSNVAISSDGRVALIADSIRINPLNPTNWLPHSRIHVMDLTRNPPVIVGEGTAGAQVSGVAIAPNGRLVLAANRAGGTVSVLALDGTHLKKIGDVEIANGPDEVSDIAFAPDGRRAYASVREKNHLRELLIDGQQVTAGARKFSCYGRPYRVITTPDGALLLTAGTGAGNGPDMDAMTVIDLEAKPPRTTDLVPVGNTPETIEISPDGRWVVSLLMNGSNLPPGDPNLKDHAEMRVFQRSGRTFRHRQTLKIGRIPEGAAFSADGKWLAVQCHPDRKVWVFRMTRSGAVDTGLKIDVPGMPSGMAGSR
ncbi:MAG: hypothetical protein FJ405_18185 [Verrucomicrobia bacterium]|nr:hypothetical protein [Verrucomicrobiota bacterium]